MRRLLTGVVLASALVLLVSGCSTTRKSTTARTAIEEQLLTESAARTVAQWPAPAELNGMSYHLASDDVDVPDAEWLKAEIDLYLLRAGMTKAADAESADVVVVPRSSAAAIDDRDLVIGIPGQEISAGPIAFDLPELALYSRDSQRGRNRMGLHAIRSEDGTLAFETPVKASETTFIRQKVLFIITWNWSDMAAPWGGKLSREYRDMEKEWKGAN